LSIKLKQIGNKYVPCSSKHKIPSNKLQISTNDQDPKSAAPHPSPLPCGEREGVRGMSLEIGDWNLFGIWDLELGI
jgi:hypothetical protein